MEIESNSNQVPKSNDPAKTSDIKIDVESGRDPSAEKDQKCKYARYSLIAIMLFMAATLIILIGVLVKSNKDPSTLTMEQDDALLAEEIK